MYAEEADLFIPFLARFQQYTHKKNTQTSHFSFPFVSFLCDDNNCLQIHHNQIRESAQAVVVVDCVKIVFFVARSFWVVNVILGGKILFFVVIKCYFGLF